MLDKLATMAGTRRETIDQLLQETPAAAPLVTQYDDEPPAWLDNAPGTRKTAPDVRPKRDLRNPEPAPVATRLKRSAGLLAVELLLHQPALALKAPTELSLLTILGDEDTNLLLELLEVARDDPDIGTYVLLGHCYGTPAGKRLTQLLKNERITPEAGRAEEFSFLLGQLLQEAQKQQKRKQLLEQLKPRVRSTKNDTEDS
jgi:DNA primase